MAVKLVEKVGDESSVCQNAKKLHKPFGKCFKTYTAHQRENNLLELDKFVQMKGRLKQQKNQFAAIVELAMSVCVNLAISPYKTRLE